MRDEQLQTIVGLISGLELAVVHLSTTLCAQTELTPADLAASFDKAAQLLPEGVHNKMLLAMVMRHVASGIRHTNPPSEFEQEVSRLLH